MNSDNILLVSEVINAKTQNFTDLVKIANLRPDLDFRYANLTGINLSNLDLSGYDFTGADLSGCRFKNARLKGAILTGAKLSPGALREAVDYRDGSWWQVGCSLASRLARALNAFAFEIPLAFPRSIGPVLTVTALLTIPFALHYAAMRPRVESDSSLTALNEQLRTFRECAHCPEMAIIPRGAYDLNLVWDNTTASRRMTANAKRVEFVISDALVH